MENLSITKVKRICTPEYVWYAAYGSNLLRSRFLCYINGLAPTENHRAHAGCRDSSDPVWDLAARCEYPVVFAGERSSWGEGGVAFLDVEGSGVETPLRLWKVTREQFEDVCAMENGLLPGAVTIDFGSLCSRGTMVVAEQGWYGLGAFLGDFEGDPVVTFTWQDRRIDLNNPSERYAGVISEGKVEILWDR
ncbi:MAG: hypothetical protein ACKVQS_02000 [Fimbriimonadaceae bacterium]